MFDFNPWNGLVLFQALQMENNRKRAPRAKRDSFLRRLFHRAPRTAIALTDTAGRGQGRGMSASRSASRSTRANVQPSRLPEREAVLSIR
jgi:hypothetical protein